MKKILLALSFILAPIISNSQSFIVLQDYDPNNTFTSTITVGGSGVFKGSMTVQGSGIISASSVTASSFFGDGSHLTGITSGELPSDIVYNDKDNAWNVSQTFLSPSSVTIHGPGGIFADYGVVAGSVTLNSSGNALTIPTGSISMGSGGITTSILASGEVVTNKMTDQGSGLVILGQSVILQNENNTAIGQITSGGNLSMSYGLSAATAAFSGALRVQGQNVPSSGAGIEIQYQTAGAGNGTILAYDRNNGLLRNIELEGSTVTIAGDGAGGIINITGGNVGISEQQSGTPTGVTHPTTNLDVNGNASFGFGVSKSTFNVDGSLNVDYGITAGSATITNSINTSPGSLASYQLQTGKGNIGFGQDASNAYIQTFSVPLQINNQGNNTILNATSGSVGIGTASPTAPLHIATASDLLLRGAVSDNTKDAYGRFTNGAGEILWGVENNAGARIITNSLPNSSYVVSNTTNAIHFGVNGVAYATILNGGNVGIGKTSPGYSLEVSAPSNGAAIYATVPVASNNYRSFVAAGNSPSTYGAEFAGGFDSSGSDYGELASFAAGTRRSVAHWSSNGFFGISNSTPTTALSVYGIISSSTTSPTVACTAGAPVMTAGSTSQAGSYAAGALATGCTVTFTQAFTKAPFCQCQASANLLVYASATATNSVTCTSATAMTGDTINYMCWSAP